MRRRYSVSITWVRFVPIVDASLQRDIDRGFRTATPDSMPGRYEHTNTGSQPFDNLPDAWTWVSQTVPDGCEVDSLTIHSEVIYE